jgi:hypothetical protein
MPELTLVDQQRDLMRRLYAAHIQREQAEAAAQARLARERASSESARSEAYQQAGEKLDRVQEALSEAEQFVGKSRWEEIRPQLKTSASPSHKGNPPR